MPDEPLSDVSKELLYGKFEAGQEKKEKLALKAAHKALDIADDGMNITATTHNTKQGINALGLLGATALPTVVLGGLALYLASQGQPPGKPVMPPAAESAKYDAVYERQQPDGTWKEIKREHLK